MSVRRFALTASLVLSFGFAAAPPSCAQSAVAVDAGVTTFRDEYETLALFETGVRFSSLTPKRVSADVRITTFPQALSGGVLLLSADVDAAYVVPLGERGYATPRLGVSVIGGAGSGGAGAMAGVNYGLGLVTRLDGPLALRFDASHRTYAGGEASIGAWAFSIGVAWLH